jgi:hypothetical protein
MFTKSCSLHCYVCFEPPLIHTPPDIPLPDPSADPEWYGEMWIKYPMNQKLLPTYFGYLFKAKADFRVIMNDIALHYFGKSESTPKLNLQKVKGFHSRLRNWYDKLPEPLTARRIVLPSHLMLQ